MIGVTVRSRAIKAIQAACEEASHEAIRACALEYKFSAEEAISKFGLVEVSDGKSKKGKKTKKTCVVKPSLTLPFCGSVLEGACHGIKLNRGLYTQCMNLPAGEGVFCTTCARQAAQNDGKPTYGTIEERISSGTEWRDPKGKAPVNYGNVMLKLNITKEAAVAEASKFGWTIAESQFEVVKAKKGRPAKAKKEKDPNAAPKKRGRPKKTKKVVTGSAGDDLIANLVAQAQASQPDEDEVSVDEEDSVAEEKVEVKAKKAARKPNKTAEEKAAEKQAKADAKAKKAADKKAAKEAEKAAKKAAKEAEKAAKKAAKEAEKAAKKAAKEAEELMKAVAKQEDLEDANTEQDEISVEDLQEMAAELTLEDHVETDDEEEDDEVEVEKFEFEGTEYLRDGNGTVYDMESQEEIGTWNGEKIVMMSGVDSDED